MKRRGPGMYAEPKQRVKKDGTPVVEEDLDVLTKAELHKLADERGVPVDATMTKDEMKAALRA